MRCSLIPALSFLAFVLICACATTPEKGPAPEAVQSRADQALDLLRTDDYAKFPEAINILNLELAASPANTEALAMAGQIHLAWAEQLSFQAEHLRMRQDAAKAFAARLTEKKAKAYSPEHAKLIDETIEKLNDDQTKLAAEIEQKNAEVQTILTQGFAEAEKVQAAQPSHYIGYRVMADYFRIKGDQEKAQAQLAKIEQLNPDSAGLHFVKGASAMNFAKDYPGALKEFDLALAKDPHFAKAHYFRGLTFDKMNDRANAKACMEAVVRISPNHPDAQTYLHYVTFFADMNSKVSELAGEK